MLHPDIPDEAKIPACPEPRSDFLEPDLQDYKELDQQLNENIQYYDKKRLGLTDLVEDDGHYQRHEVIGD